MGIPSENPITPVELGLDVSQVRTSRIPCDRVNEVCTPCERVSEVTPLPPVGSKDVQLPSTPFAFDLLGAYKHPNDDYAWTILGRIKDENNGDTLFVSFYNGYDVAISNSSYFTVPAGEADLTTRQLAVKRFNALCEAYA